MSKKEPTKKELNKLKSSSEYIFANWAAEQGWEPVMGSWFWKKGKSVLTLSQLRRVFQDHINAHHGSD